MKAVVSCASLILLSFLLVESQSFRPSAGTGVRPFSFRPHHSKCSSTQCLATISVPASEIEQNLSQDERVVVSVVRERGPSVAFVTSVLPDQRPSPQIRGRRRDNKTDDSSNLPPGRGLGSGSGFVVDQQGYLVTNYHVIERAYQLQRMSEIYESGLDRLAQNVTNITGLAFRTVNTTLQQILNPTTLRAPLPKVYVRINSKTDYQLCQIVDVHPALDVAVLKIVTPKETSPWLAPMSFGSSSDLLVGQGLIAIGNPFGLDNTVTTGVVSALNRELRTRGNDGMVSPPIRNCIQTDCAINPGNSGGPLLNLKGEVVGVNTAIVTTSGSSAGIGFAVPSDEVKDVVERMIRTDRVKKGTQYQAWLGLAIVKATSNCTLGSKNWVAKVMRKSPAAEAGVQAIRVFEQDASVQYGDAVVAIGGNAVNSYDALRKDLDTRVPGEKVALTLEDSSGDRRVVYITLGTRP